MKITNKADLPLSIAVWLLNDNYDYSVDPNHVSVTSLIKPLRSIVLSRRLPPQPDMDLIDRVPSRLGTAIHESVEDAWKSSKLPNILSTLKGLFNLSTDKKIILNPDKVIDDIYPIYMERRSSKKFGKYTVSGKFDFVYNGRLEDFKSTSVWKWIFQSGVKDFTAQASMYRYLNQDIITEDLFRITYIFTDWSATKALQDRDYPKTRIITKLYPLAPVKEVEEFIQNRLNAIDHLQNAAENLLPVCTKEELWQKDAIWKYYKNPAKISRSTKNFDNKAEAHQRLHSDGNVGTVIEYPGKVVRCNYCSAATVCNQRAQYEKAGLL